MGSCRLSVVASAAAVLMIVTPAGAQSQRAVPRSNRVAGRAARPPVLGAPARAAAFVDVSVIPMDSERVLPHQTVLVEGGRIAALGPVATTPVPQGARRIDGQGQYLMPGLGSCHGHIVASGIASSNHSDPRQAKEFLFLVFASGVTTLRNVDYIDGDQPELTSSSKDHWGQWLGGRWWLKAADRRQLRAQAAAGKSWSPRIYMSGQWAPVQYITGWQLRDEVRQRLPAPRLDSIAAYVAAYKAAGYNFIKLHDETKEVAESVFVAARRVGIQVGGHVRPGTYAEVLAGGQQVADHGEPHNGDPDLPDTSVAADAGVRRRAGLWNCDVARPQIRPMADSGVGLLLGQDGSPGPGQFREFIDSGVTPYRALATGTKAFGQYLRTLDRHGDETGTIAVGQRADLLLLPGNPLTDIRNMEISAFPVDDYNEPWPTDSTPKVGGIMIGGRWMPGTELRRRTVVTRLWRALDIDHEQVLRAGGVDTTLAPALQQKLRQLEAVHYGQRYALLERFVLTPAMPAGGTDSLRGAEWLVALAARQLGEMRAALPAAVQERFDEQARGWLKRRAAAGYHVVIPGVRP